MQIKYKTDKLEKVCENLKEARKNFSGIIPEKLHAAINYIKSSSTIIDIINYRPFHFHDLENTNKGARKGQYAIDIGGRKSGVRLILIPLDANGNKYTNEDVFGANAINIVIVQLEEVTNHYE